MGGSDAEHHLISYRQFLSHTAHIRVLANELGQRKISVNAVEPGPVATDIFLKGKSEELIASIAKMAPFERIAEADDIVGIVAFLAGRGGAWINGQVIRASGGYV